MFFAGSLPGLHVTCIINIVNIFWQIVKDFPDIHFMFLCRSEVVFVFLVFEVVFVYLVFEVVFVYLVFEFAAIRCLNVVGAVDTEPTTPNKLASNPYQPL